MQAIVMYSGGIGSWAAGMRTVARYGLANTTLLFCDTKQEDEDLYRFLHEGAAVIGVPVTVIADGRTPWDVFRDERYLGNNRVDLCSRVLKRELADAWIAKRYAPDECIRVVGMDYCAREAHRLERLQLRCAPYKVEAPLFWSPPLDKDLAKLLALQHGLTLPRLYAFGFQHNNCFLPETSCVTANGIKPLGDLVGHSATFLSSYGAWTPGNVYNFGRQPIWKLTLRRGGRLHQIATTREHRWVCYRSPRGHTRMELQTHQLQPGHRLVTLYGGRMAGVRPSAFGIAHGIVYGDGCAPQSAVQTQPAHVVLCGEKNRELLRWFPLQPVRPVAAGLLVSDLPRTFKAIPSLSESKSYLLGFLQGWFAADGSVTKNEACLSTAHLHDAAMFRDMAALLGIGTTMPRVEQRRGIDGKITPLYTVALVNKTIPDDFYLLSGHHAKWQRPTHDQRDVCWMVESVTPTDGHEDVYCAVVSGTHEFVLDGNILTGNCGGACVRAGQEQWATLHRVLPKRFFFHAKQEKLLRIFLGKDVSILRDRSGGKTRPLTLEAFEERLQRFPELPFVDDTSDCDCFA